MQPVDGVLDEFDEPDVSDIELERAAGYGQDKPRPTCGVSGRRLRIVSVHRPAC
jgi:hypothetical protein